MVLLSYYFHEILDSCYFFIVVEISCANFVPTVFVFICDGSYLTLPESFVFYFQSFIIKCMLMFQFNGVL